MCMYNQIEMARVTGVPMTYLLTMCVPMTYLLTMCP